MDAVYLYQSCVVHEQCDKTTQQIAITEIAGLAHFYVFNHSKTVMATPTFTIFATELWLKEQVLLAKYPKIKSGYKGMVFSEIIAQQLSGGEFVRDMIVAVMVKGAGGSADTLAAYNIKYLRSALAVDSPNFDLIRVLIFILMVSCDGNGEILAAFERRSGITFATKAFLAAANRITKSMDFDVLQTLRVSYLFFDNMSLLQTNPGWIAKALEAGLLSAFLLSCSVVETKLDSSLAMVAVKVFDIIKKAFVLHSVLLALEQPFQEIIESDIAKPRVAGLLWKEWVSFTDMAKERLMIMDVADMCRVTKSSSSRTCGFSAVSGFDIDVPNFMHSLTFIS
ncbi:hypothetical protein SERLA73DRAFT_78573 [Serpula lacrymans var. lacrymans S7.3]|uniref:Uncharacterized protein n=2 Tax=Serpula lacrymans var. lacrymans TaxID=341189 RepID=F8QDP2_SERL3|nr:uncharacterized protein SERLADRAFT_443618 [Serpula lacrymans var. lacrymans S7.9]EGN93713.1 hypothetical protein SERLA73DRAFT_78573 [Serpula lacrymans var. lacrymans S7.3]EGO19083.1 hypothetical protein SERLADRAFT_443618 [Serpula lacrymans var. lacrymans S7.9]